MERERGGPGGKLGTGQKGLEQRGFSKGASAKRLQQRGLQQSGFSKGVSAKGASAEGLQQKSGLDQRDLDLQGAQSVCWLYYHVTTMRCQRVNFFNPALK